jgi:hypothetical protein
MAEPELRMLQTMVQRVLDEQRAMRQDLVAFHEYLVNRFEHLSSNDVLSRQRDIRMHVIKTMLNNHEHRIVALEAKEPAE